MSRNLTGCAGCSVLRLLQRQTRPPSWDRHGYPVRRHLLTHELFAFYEVEYDYLVLGTAGGDASNIALRDIVIATASTLIRISTADFSDRILSVRLPISINDRGV